MQTNSSGRRNFYDDDDDNYNDNTNLLVLTKHICTFGAVIEFQR